MTDENTDDLKLKTVSAMNLIANCIHLNGISDSVSLGAMYSLIANMLIHHKVSPDKVKAIFHSLNGALADLGINFSGHET